MTVFEAARQADCIQAAEKLGIRTRRSGGKAYACCLFHAEKTPSLCLYPCLLYTSRNGMEQVRVLSNEERKHADTITE